tara:strand:- start:113 stop:538 length:426 start_codon:yes stop_codon:yes gene_type:complete
VIPKPVWVCPQFVVLHLVVTPIQHLDPLAQRVKRVYHLAQLVLLGDKVGLVPEEPQVLKDQPDYWVLRVLPATKVLQAQPVSLAKRVAKVLKALQELMALKVFKALKVPKVHHQVAILVQKVLQVAWGLKDPKVFKAPKVQ